MKYTHEDRCLADRACFGNCIHDPVTGERIDPVEVTMKVTPEGTVTYQRLRIQQHIVPPPQ